MAHCNPQNDLNCYHNQRWQNYNYDAESSSTDSFSQLQSRIDDELFRHVIDLSPDRNLSPIEKKLLDFGTSYEKSSRTSGTVLRLINEILKTLEMSYEKAIPYLGNCMALANRIGVATIVNLGVTSHYQVPSVYVTHIYDLYQDRKGLPGFEKRIPGSVAVRYKSMESCGIKLPRMRKYVKLMTWFIQQTSRRCLTPEDAADPYVYCNSVKREDFLKDRSPFWRHFLAEHSNSPFVSYNTQQVIDYLDAFLKENPKKIIPAMTYHLVSSVFSCFTVVKPDTFTSSPETKISTFSELIRSYFGPYLEDIYDEKHASLEKETAIRRMFDAMISHSIDMVSIEPCFEEHTRHLAAEKLSKIQLLVGKQGFRFDLAEFPCMSTTNIQRNMMRINSFYYSQRLKMLGRPMVGSYLGISDDVFSFTVNAYYDPHHNVVYVPTAICSDEFFDLKSSPQERYGGLGSIIGHEIIHSFDNNGSLYDSNGLLNQWWSKDDHRRYEKEMLKILRQYRTVSVDQVPVNSPLTLSENISDVVGIKISLRTLLKEHPSDDPEVVRQFIKKWVTTFRGISNPFELKLVQGLDPHAPRAVRTNLPFSHLKEFYQVYDLQPTDKNYLPPQDRLRFFEGE